MQNDRLNSGPFLTSKELLSLASFSIWKLSLGIIAATMYMRGTQPLKPFLTSKPGMISLCAITAFFFAGGFVIHQYRLGRRLQSFQFARIVGMNVVILVFLVVTGELIVNADFLTCPYGDLFVSQPLNSKTWDQLKLRYQRHAEYADDDPSYVTCDSQRGWTVGADWHSGNGLYCSSSVGMRTVHPEMSFATPEGNAKIVLVGDSFICAEAVRYEESWAFHLIQMSFDKFQLLNYGSVYPKTETICADRGDTRGISRRFEFVWNTNDLPGLYDGVGLTVDVGSISGRRT